MEENPIKKSARAGGIWAGTVRPGVFKPKEYVKGPEMTRSVLSDEEFELAKAIVLNYLRELPSITNREFRSLTRLSHDQGVGFFNRMVSEGHLSRTGKASGIKYVLAS